MLPFKTHDYEEVFTVDQRLQVLNLDEYPSEKEEGNSLTISSELEVFEHNPNDYPLRRQSPRLDESANFMKLLEMSSANERGQNNNGGGGGICLNPTIVVSFLAFVVVLVASLLVSLIVAKCSAEREQKPPSPAPMSYPSYPPSGGFLHIQIV
jgi:hypothetical protein